MSAPFKVALVKCADYASGVPEAVDRLLAHLGGLSAFVRPGQTVLIKPNLLTKRTPDQAVTTHPEVARAVIRRVRDAGAIPVVGDSPADVVKLETIWKATGFADLCREEGVELVNLEKAGAETVTANGYTFSISKTVLSSDLVINLPKVKTHNLTTLTAAVKNLYGTVPGFQKANLHKLHPNAVDFCRLLAEIYRKVRPRLTLADAVVGMDGEGPSAGTPRPLGFLAASDDAVALDLVLCRILRLKPRAVPYLDHLVASSPAGQWDDIQILGENPDTLFTGAFKAPGTLMVRLVPNWLSALLGPFIWVRPAFSDLCVFCGQCVKACPAKALSQAPRQKPVLARERCIGCCCCHEVCPRKAVTMTLSPLLNALQRKAPAP